MHSSQPSRTRSKITVLFLALALMTLSMGTAACSLTDSASDEAGEPMIASDFSNDSMEMNRSIEVAEEYAPTAAQVVGSDVADVATAQSLVIRTAGLRIDVEDVESSVDDVRSAAETRGGHVTEVQISTQEEIPVYRYEAQGSLSDGAALSGYITARIPAESYEDFLEDIRGIGEVVRQVENESDVTQQHIDLQARLTNLQAQEQRLREFFDRADDVEGLLAIEQELTRVRAEIDSLEGQIAYLERQAAMSTVTIELVGPTPVVSPSGEGWGFVEAITSGIRGAASVLRFAIAFIIATSPAWVIGVIAFLVIRTMIKRRNTDSDSSIPEEIS